LVKLVKTNAFLTQHAVHCYFCLKLQKRYLFLLCTKAATAFSAS